MRGNPPGGDFLFGDDRNSGRRPRERSQDNQLGRAIRLGDRRFIPLRFHFEAAPDDREDGFACLSRGCGQVLGEPPVIGLQRGAIRIPPSRRTAAAFM